MDLLEFEIPVLYLFNFLYWQCLFTAVLNLELLTIFKLNVCDNIASILQVESHAILPIAPTHFILLCHIL